MQTRPKNTTRSNPYSNAEWALLLRDPADNQALAQLRTILVKNVRIGFFHLVTREIDQFAEDVVQDGLLRILEYINTYREEGSFLSWASRITLNEGRAELRKKRWQDSSLYDEPDKQCTRRSLLQTATSPTPDPLEITIANNLSDTLKRIIREELSDKRRRTLLDNKLYGIPAQCIADYEKTHRGAIYKRIYDAKEQIRNSLNRLDKRLLNAN